MLIKKAYRYELKPNVSQALLLAKHAGAARFAYNWALNLRIEMYEKEKKQTNAISQHKLLNTLKSTHFPWMYEVSKCAPQEALRDLDQAFSHFFKGLKSGKPVGFPKFRKKSRRESFRLTGTIKIENKEIQLPRLGKIKLKEKSKVKGKILSATVSKEADRWYVSLLVETERQVPIRKEKESIGIDVGLHFFAALSNGDKHFSPKPLAKKLKRLKTRSKQHSRKILGSKNRQKAALKLARLHRKIRNTRQDFLHKLSTHLAKTKSEIIIEDLDIKGMLNKFNLNKSIHDASFSEFRRQLTYKTEWYGSKLIVAPRFYPSTKTCSVCASIMEEIPLALRKWQCPHCRTLHDRDINAAKNLLKFSTGSSPGIYACGDTSTRNKLKLVDLSIIEARINEWNICP